MPTVSIYLDSETLEGIRACAEHQGTSFSGIIQDVLSRYLHDDRRQAARRELLELLGTRGPLGHGEEIREVHRERMEIDENRA